MSMSNAEETRVLNHSYRTATYTKPTNIWVALFDTDPGETGVLTGEADYGSYARVQVPAADANWNAPADDGSGNMQITNAIDIEFPDSTGDGSAPITHFATMDAAAAGNVIDTGALATPRTIMSGDAAIRFPAGTLTIKRG